MIKAVFFDYDGVLTRDKTGSLTTNRFLSDHTGISFETVCDAFRPYNAELNEGKRNYSDIWPEVCATLRHALPRELLLAAFESTPTNAEMFAMARELKTRCAVGIITDNKKERIEHLRRYQHLDELFAPIVVSAEIRCTKSAPAIFQYALACLGVRPEDSLFIDNSVRSLLAPATLGMKVVYFDDEKNDVPGLARHISNELGA